MKFLVLINLQKPVGGGDFTSFSEEALKCSRYLSFPQANVLVMQNGTS